MDTDYRSALAHIVGGLILIGYANNYYFHLRTWTLQNSLREDSPLTTIQVTTRTTRTRCAVRNDRNVDFGGRVSVNKPNGKLSTISFPC